MRSILTVLLGLFTLQLSAQSPCVMDSIYRSFDFWIGKWDVYNGEKFAGTNDVILLLDSCVIQENWESANNNYRGKSFNYFDQKTGKWNQTWVDNQGGSLQFSGTINGNQLILQGKSQNPEGEAVLHKMIFTNNDNGSVTQLWQTSKDGETWKTVFNGLYIPKGEKLENYLRQ